VLSLSIKRLDNFSLKLLFRVQITNKDLTILLSYFAIFQMLSILQIVIIIIITRLFTRATLVVKDFSYLPLLIFFIQFLSGEYNEYVCFFV
jgi:hypothetical protein